MHKDHHITHTVCRTKPLSITGVSPPLLRYFTVTEPSAGLVRHRHEDPLNELPKLRTTELRPAYENVTEALTHEELDDLISDPDEMRMQVSRRGRRSEGGGWGEGQSAAERGTDGGKRTGRCGAAAVHLWRVQLRVLCVVVKRRLEIGARCSRFVVWRW